MSLFEYTDGQTTFEGHLALGDNEKSKRPCVLVAHAWSGPSEHFNKIADAISEAGFIGFAIDVYGKGVRGKVDGDNSHLMNPLLEDRALLRKRLLAAFQAAQKHPSIIEDQIAILGYCFGGLCALDLARANPKGLKGAISIHGLLNAPNIAAKTTIDSSILVLHGWSDPTVPPSQVMEFAQEMTLAKADWQLHAYGQARHAFSFIGANIPELGIEYNENADKRSKKSAFEFLNEIFEDRAARTIENDGFD
jgi:dienelactone hydrolase